MGSRAVWVAGVLAALAACEQGQRARDVLRGVPHPDAAAPALDGGAPPEPVARVCSGDGWCWDGLGIQNNALHAVAGDTTGEVWAVGELGVALHHDGHGWAALWAPTRESLRGLWVGGGELWAVGEHATLVFHGRDGWSAQVLPGVPWDTSLRAVWVAGGSVWVAGTNGVLLERRAGEWASVDAAIGASWNAVWASGDEVWAVGDAGAVLRRGPEGWARLDPGSERDLLAVRGRAGEVWVAGSGGELLRHDVGTATWQRPSGPGPAPEGRLGALHVDAELVLVANERGQLFAWDAARTCAVHGDAGVRREPCPEWRATRASGSEAPIFGLWASDDSVLAVGALGAITRWDGEARTAISESSAHSFLAVAGRSASDVWVAGDRLLTRRDGAWSEVAMDSPRAATAVQPLDGGRTLIAGGGGLARAYANDAWHSMDVGQDVWLHGLFSDGTQGWLVGAGGQSWGLLNGRLWVPLATPTERDLRAVFGLPSGAVWAVGAGVTLRHDGAEWLEIPLGAGAGAGAELRAVWGSADDDVWAVGGAGTVLHWDGVAWSASAGDAPYSLDAVWGRGRDDVWAAGSAGTLLHYDGASWQPEFSGTTQALHALWGTATRLWAVGEHGTILVKDLD